MAYNNIEDICDMKDNQILYDGIRRALLVLLDAWERWQGISPTTAEIRKTFKGK